MSSTPDQKPPEPAAEPAPETALPAAPEAAPAPAAEHFAAAPMAKPETEPEPDAAPEPEPAPEPAATTAPDEPAPPVEDAPLFRSIPSGPRKRSKPAPSKPKPKPTIAPAQPQDLEPEAGDFDAVFEARSDAGLGDRLTPTVCYLLMVFSPLTLGVAAIPAVVLAYMNRETAPAWMASHYVYQIRTFWAAVFIALAAIGTIFFWERGIIALAFGVFFNLVLLLGVAWFVLRAANGLMRLRRALPISNPRRWGL